LRILGQDAETLAREARADPSRRLMRLFIAVRTRFTGDALPAAYGRGVRQVVVLGAGLEFSEIECLGPPEIRARYFPGHKGSGSEKGGHILRATTV